MHHNSVPSQSTISAYFHSATQEPHPRKRTTIDLTVGDEDYEPPVKRPRASGSSFPISPIRSEVSPKETAPSVADSWRFLPEKSQGGPSRPRTFDELARHEAFKRKLLSDNSRFLEKPERIGLDQHELMDEGGTEVSDSDDDSDRFKKLSEMFSHEGKCRGKGKGKSTGAARRVQRTEEVGPSGQSYTPLEKQVCSSYLRDLLNMY